MKIKNPAENLYAAIHSDVYLQKEFYRTFVQKQSEFQFFGIGMIIQFPNFHAAAIHVRVAAPGIARAASKRKGCSSQLHFEVV